MKIAIEAEKECRRYLSKHGYRGRNNLYVEIVDGNKPPHVCGDSWHYETKGGRYIRYPSAYSKSGWSSMVYVNSTKHIKVGKDWIKQVEIDIEQLRLSKIKGKVVHREIAKFSYLFC